MTYEFFREYFDFTEYDVISIEIKNNKLYIYVSMPIYLELIANGYRPEMNMTQEKTFVFSVEGNNKKYPTDINIVFNENAIVLGKESLRLNDFRVDVI